MYIYISDYEPSSVGFFSPSTGILNDNNEYTAYFFENRVLPVSFMFFSMFVRSGNSQSKGNHLVLS